MIKCGERFENDCHPFIILRGKKRMNRVKCDLKRDFFQIIFILSVRKNVYKTHKKSNLLRYFDSLILKIHPACLLGTHITVLAARHKNWILLNFFSSKNLPHISCFAFYCIYVCRTSQCVENSGTVCFDCIFSKEQQFPKQTGLSAEKNPMLSNRNVFWPRRTWTNQT